MAKYIDGNRPRSEIELRINELNEQIVDIFDSKAVLRKDECQRLLSVIGSLQQEQPEVDLEQEIERVVEKYNSLANGRRVIKPSGIEKIARHFAEWGAEHLKK